VNFRLHAFLRQGWLIMLIFWLKIQINALTKRSVFTRVKKMCKKISVIVFVASIVMASAQVNAWKFHASFDNGTLGQKADNGGDGFHGAGGRSVYTDEQKLKGQAVKMQIQKGEEGYGNWGGVFPYPKTYKGETIWFLVHTYMPLEFDHYAYSAGNRLKFLRLQTLTAAGNNIGYNDIYFDMKSASNPFAYIYEGENAWVTIGGASEYPVKDTWESYEIAVTLDNVSVDNGGKGQVRFWKNGVLLKNITNRITLRDANAYSDRALLFTYWNGGSPKDQFMYADEITVTNEQPSQVDAQGNRYVGGLLKQRPVMTTE
jgi:hypothetical protein